MIRNWLRYANLMGWYLRGRPNPPPGTYKRLFLKRLAAQRRLTTFVETGTLMGETLFVLKDSFSSLYSVELSAELYAKARQRLSKYSQIHLYHGDSAVELPVILSKLTAPALFWLDAHYSGGITAKSEKGVTPISKELMYILMDSKPHTIVIDDLRLFGSDPGYPTFPALKKHVEDLGQGRFSITKGPDCIVITPAS